MDNEVNMYRSGDLARIQAWPMLKWRRAVEHMDGLAARVDLFNERRAYAAPIRLSEDKNGLEFLRPDGVQPPLEEWALYFADSVHNLRVALDSLAWEMAVMGGELPPNPHLISFPVALKQNEWKSAVSRLGTVTEELLARVERLQPFHDPETPPERHVLVLLSKLDNAEKHRRTLVSRFDVSELEFGGNWSLEASNDQGDAGFLMHPLDDPSPGDVVAEFRWGAVITPISNEPTYAPLKVTPMITLGNDYFPALQFLSHAAEWVHTAINSVRLGGRMTWGE